MLRITLLTLATVLTGGCALDLPADSLDVGESTETGEDGHGLDPALDLGSDNLVPFPVPADPQPGRRITSVAHEHGDLIITATIAASVLEHYPDADHYAIRFDAEREYVVVVVADGEGNSIEPMRFTRTPSAYYPATWALAVELPTEAPPSAEGCLALACPWEPSWPPAGVVSDRLEISRVGEMVRIHGRIDGAESYRHLMLDPSSEDILVTDESVPDDLGRLVAVNAVLADLVTLAPEVETVEDCLWCALGSLWTMSKTGNCVAGILTECMQAWNGVTEFDDECAGACG